MSKGIAWRVRELAVGLPNNKGNDWVYDSNCYGKETSDFIYTRTELPEGQRYKLKKICEGCPVIDTCRYEAVRNQEEGWWGGMDRKERMEWAAKELFHLV